MDKIESQALFQQVRVAHRMAAAYYKRLFQLLKEVTGDERLGLSFLAWEPEEFDRPCSKRKNVFESWEWDLLPGIGTRYLFFRGKSLDEQSNGDWLLDCHVITDTGVTGDWDGENKDPLDLEVTAKDANSVIRCHLLAPIQDGKLKWFEDVWDGSDDLDTTESPVINYANDEKTLNGCSFEISLEDLTGSDAPEILVQKIMEYRDTLLAEVNDVANVKDVI